MAFSHDSRIAAAQAGDPQAAGELVSEHHERVFAYLRRLAGNDADAEDLTQRTFARVWTSLSRFSGHSSISSWIHGIAHHVLLDWLRSRRPCDAQTDAWWDQHPAPGPTPADTVAAADLSRVVFAAVDTLDADLKHPVHLHYYQGLTLQETAEALGVSTSTVKNRLRAALAAIHGALDRRPTVISQRIA
ncbi:MAG: RNA polymerase sigma factor [Verrucomicrobiae bacterium]|nr:RNA polymerase sigma factor [Verrucomicrobiae bacterium]